LLKIKRIDGNNHKLVLLFVDHRRHLLHSVPSAGPLTLVFEIQPIEPQPSLRDLPLARAIAVMTSASVVPRDPQRSRAWRVNTIRLSGSVGVSLIVASPIAWHPEEQLVMCNRRRTAE
jgi:hypothetical protein